MEAPSGAVPQFLNGSAVMWPFTLLHCSAVYVTPECRAAYPACPLGVHHIPVKPSVFQLKPIAPLFAPMHISHVFSMGLTQPPCSMSLNPPNATGQSVLL